jgi:hypothetical protein
MCLLCAKVTFQTCPDYTGRWPVQASHRFSVVSNFISSALKTRPPPSLSLPGVCRMHYVHEAVRSSQKAVAQAATAGSSLDTWLCAAGAAEHAIFHGI